MRTLKRIFKPAIPILIFVIFLLLVVLIKNYYYSDWTWVGFITDINKIFIFLGTLVPFSILIWQVYRTDEPKQQFIVLLKRIIISDKIITISFSLIGLIIILGITVLTLKKQHPSDLSYFLVTHNWEFAEKELLTLKEKPIKKEMIETYEYYINEGESIDNTNYPDGEVIREQRNAIWELLQNGYDNQGLNSISYAESCLEIC
jgi:hypothetical protein